MKDHAHWIVTADARQATLYACQMAPDGHWHLAQQKTLENQWENYHEHHRPSALGRGPSTNAAQHFASSGHESEEEHRRFARQVGSWLTRAVDELGAEHVSIFAATRFLGLLREELGALSLHMDLHAVELTRLAPTELLSHPAVIRVLRPHEAVHQSGA